MRIETILKLWCPRCDAVNYLDIGDVSDQTGHDAEGFRCHACRGRFLLDDDGEEPDPDEFDEDDPRFEDGLEALR